MRRLVVFLGLALLASLLVFVPTAGAGLDATDTATGNFALANENGGVRNTADGYNALGSQVTATNNTAVGFFALASNTLGDNDTAVGIGALQNNTSGFGVAGFGDGALGHNTSGDGNAALGESSLNQITTGSDNIGVGAGAGGNFLDGGSSNNTFVGADTGTSITSQLTNATAIGASAQVNESNALVLGDSGVNVGVGTTTPRSLLQVGVASNSYGSYLQLPAVTNGSNPPGADCNSTTFVGRLVLQYDAQKVRTTLWSCSPAGVWTKLAQG